MCYWDPCQVGLTNQKKEKFQSSSTEEEQCWITKKGRLGKSVGNGSLYSFESSSELHEAAIIIVFRDIYRVPFFSKLISHLLKLARSSKIKKVIFVIYNWLREMKSHCSLIRY